MAKEKEGTIMTTEATEYTSSAGKYEELYGKIMQATSTHVFSNEGKALQYLTNEFILAAKADLRAEKQNPPGIQNNYDIFINRLAAKIQKDSEPIKSESIKSAFNSSYGLEEMYKNIKDELRATRVRGVEKTVSESLVTMAANAARVVIKALAPMRYINALASALSLESNPARDLSRTGFLRGELKDTLKKYMIERQGKNSLEGLLTPKKLAQKAQGQGQQH